MKTGEPFIMHGIRKVLPSEASHIEQQAIAIEEAVAQNAGLTFDLAKTLIESACKTILTDRGYVVDSGWELPKLLKETLGKIQLVPAGCDQSAGVTDSLRKTVGGLQTVIQGICELRNSHGFASHGKDAYARQLETVQAELAARSADAVTSFLFRAHHQYSNPCPERRISYQDNSEFNEHIDESNEQVRIFEFSYRPSEVLFNVDEDAYRDLLSSFQAGQGETVVTKANEVTA